MYKTLNSKKLFISVILAASLACLLHVTNSYAAPQRIPNLYQDKQELITYYNSGQYAQDINQVVGESIVYLQQRIAENNALPKAKQKKLALVLDIDETSLSNYADMKAMDFGGTEQEIEHAMALGHDPAVKATLKLYLYARKHNITVFFITGRPQALYQATQQNLIKAGYTTWQKLIMRPDNYANKSIVPFKSAARHVIENAGYDIVLHIGDQQSDLIGGYADKTFKLPNPFYYLP